MNLKKILVMKTRPEISDQEIHAMMDFNKVLDDHRIAKRKGNITRAGLISGVVALVAFSVWYFMRPTEMQQAQIVVADSVATKLSEPQQNQVLTAKSPATNDAPATRDQQEHAQPATRDPRPEQTPTSEPASSYSEAEPVSGYPNLYAYFQKELRYPVEALKDSIEGIVSVSFVINKEGKPEKIKVENSLGTAFDNEAIRVITGMPEWKAASMNGKPVPARISMPLTFQIDKKQP